VIDPVGRGAGWVWGQFALIGLIAVLCIVPPRWPHATWPWLWLVGFALVVAGIACGAWAAMTLGRSLTVFPRPLEGAELVVAGPYQFVRHPVYGAGLVLFLGLSLCRGPLVLPATAFLAVVWALKARVEERYLRDRYPDYGAYAQRVRYRLLPAVY
jgi:protein-S-isoprenylcysteine O-methyltransferase Ste14